MGRRLSRSTARQHPDLTTRAPDGARVVILAVLAFDGVLSAVVGALLLPLYVGSIPVPDQRPDQRPGERRAGVGRAAVDGGATGGRVAAVGLAADGGGLTLGGPGGDIVFGGAGVMAYSPLIFIAVGAAPPAYVLWRHLRSGG